MTSYSVLCQLYQNGGITLWTLCTGQTLAMQSTFCLANIAEEQLCPPLGSISRTELRIQEALLPVLYCSSQNRSQAFCDKSVACIRERFGRGRREFILATFRETSCGRCKSIPGKAYSAGLHALEGRSRDLPKPLYSSPEKTCVTSSESCSYFSRVKQ